jgi:hypothetical protein
LAEEVAACAAGLRLDSICAVVSRYSKLVPVDCAASRMAPARYGRARAPLMEQMAMGYGTFGVSPVDRAVLW